MEERAYNVTMIAIDRLEPHPENDRLHPDRQIEHLRHRFRRRGWYKNVVAALWEDRLTILAGHGITTAAKLEGATEAPCYVLAIDPLSPEAIDILTGDNTSGDMAEANLELKHRHLEQLAAAGLLLGVGVEESDLAAMRLAVQLAEEPPAPPPSTLPPGELPPSEFAPVEPDELTFRYQCRICSMRWGKPAKP